MEALLADAALTGGPVTGGALTGGSATGGSVTGGSVTGGSATGGALTGAAPRARRRAAAVRNGPGRGPRSSASGSPARPARPPLRHPAPGHRPPHWDGFPLRDALAERLGLPVVVDKDTNAAAFGLPSPAAALTRSRTCTSVRAWAPGSSWRAASTGRAHRRGEFGHQVIQLDGPRCGCGNHGCVEALCLAAVADGDPARAGRLLGVGAANLVRLLDIDRVLLGGRVLLADPEPYRGGWPRCWSRTRRAPAAGPYRWRWPVRTGWRAPSWRVRRGWSSRPWSRSADRSARSADRARSRARWGASRRVRHGRGVRVAHRWGPNARRRPGPERRPCRCVRRHRDRRPPPGPLRSKGRRPCARPYRSPGRPGRRRRAGDGGRPRHRPPVAAARLPRPYVPAGTTRRASRRRAADGRPRPLRARRRVAHLARTAAQHHRCRVPRRAPRRGPVRGRPGTAPARRRLRVPRGGCWGGHWRRVSFVTTDEAENVGSSTASGLRPAAAPHGRRARTDPLPRPRAERRGRRERHDRAAPRRRRGLGRPVARLPLHGRRAGSGPDTNPGTSPKPRPREEPGGTAGAAGTASTAPGAPSAAASRVAPDAGPGGNNDAGGAGGGEEGGKGQAARPGSPPPAALRRCSDSRSPAPSSWRSASRSSSYAPRPPPEPGS
ncbi:ROK family protein [Streptomyces sp. M19]